MILNDLLIVFAVSGLVVYAFQRLRLPSVVGLLAGGMLVGPHGLGLVENSEEVNLLAEVGVVVLLFTVGLEFSLSRLVALGRLMLLLGLPQVLLSIAATVLLSSWYFSSLNASIFAGMLVAMSSTAVVIKLLNDQGELGTPHGRMAVAVLLLQDLLVIIFVLAVPLLSAASDPQQSPWLALMIGIVVVAGILVAGRYLLPWLLHQVVRTRNRELFLITIFLACIGTAALTKGVGLSLALGAFLAGLVLSESEYSHQAMAEVLPFRDTLASLFFVSIGMLLDLQLVLKLPFTVLGVVAVLMLVKLLAVALPGLWFGLAARPTIRTAFALAQVGEFSFVLAESGRDARLLDGDQYQIFLAAAVLTMAITPFLLAAGPRLADALINSGWGRWLGRSLTAAEGETPPGLHDHVIIAGYGFNGRNLARALRDLGFPYLVLETNPELVRRRKREGESIEFGDCTRPAVLEHAAIKHARVLVVAISDATATRRAVRIARHLNPGVRVVVRTRYQTEIAELLKIGANEVVPEEFETSVEVLSRVLEELEIPHHTIRQVAENIREDHYAAFRDAGRVPLLPP